MAFEASIIVGSGQNAFKYGLGLAAHPNGERYLRGTQVVVANPEDSSAGLSGVVTRVDVDTNVTALPSGSMPYRRAIAIYNRGSSTLFIGFSPEVTTSNGWPIPASSSLPMDINGSVQVWGVAAGPLDVRILELS